MAASNIQKMAAIWSKEQLPDQEPLTLGEIEEQGWEELGEYEFRGTEEQWTALEQETPDWKKSMERLGWEFIEDSKNDIAHLKLGEEKG